MKKIPKDIFPIIEDLKARLRETYGDRLVKLVLFGSRARGDNDPESDIDVLVVLREPRDEAADDAASVSIEVEFDLEYGKMVSLYLMGESRYHRPQNPLLMNIAKEGVGIV